MGQKRKNGSVSILRLVNSVRKLRFGGVTFKSFVLLSWLESKGLDPLQQEVHNFITELRTFLKYNHQRHGP